MSPVAYGPKAKQQMQRKKYQSVSAKLCTNHLPLRPWMTFHHPPGGDFPGAGLGGKPSWVHASGREGWPLTKSFGTGVDQSNLSGRRVAEKGGTARGTVGRRMHRNTPIAPSSIAVGHFQIASSNRHGLSWPADWMRCEHDERGKAFAQAIRRKPHENGVAHARAPSSIDCPRSPRSVPPFSRQHQIRARLVYPALAPQTRSSPK